MQKENSQSEQREALPEYEVTDNAVKIICPDPDTTLNWLAALLAQELPCNPRRDKLQRWVLVVPLAWGRIAISEIREYERINRNWPEDAEGMNFEEDPALLEAPEWDRARGYALLIPLLLLLWYALVGSAESQGVLLQRGAARAELILDGEWWRILTALTLHADFSHVFSNCVALTFFGYFVLRRAGAGAGWLLILLGGGIGNALTALVMQHSHSAIGASTAGFAALGACTALQVSVHLRRPNSRLFKLRHRAWITVVAGLTLLAFLGTSPGSDITAHLFGFICGVILIILVFPFLQYHHRRLIDRICLGIFFLLLITAWLLAYANGG